MSDLIDMYFTDIIQVVTITVDKWGVETAVIEPSPDEPNSRVEDLNRLILDQFGQEVFGEMLIILNTQKAIKYGDRIIILAKAGVLYPQPTKQFEIKKLTTTVGFTGSHKEVYV